VRWVALEVGIVAGDVALITTSLSLHTFITVFSLFLRYSVCWWAVRLFLVVADKGKPDQSLGRKATDPRFLREATEDLPKDPKIAGLFNPPPNTRSLKGDTLMCTRLITANITVPTSLLFLFIGCAGTTLTVEEEYDRQEADIRIAMEYDNKYRDCRQTGGQMVVPGPRTRKIGAKLSTDQMRWARCSSLR